MHKAKKSYSITDLCKIAGVSRSAYYSWAKDPYRPKVLEDAWTLAMMRFINSQHPDMGHRRIADELAVRFDIKISDQKCLRLCRIAGIASNLKYKPKGCTKADKNATYKAENLMARNFKADAPLTKLNTDVSEYKYYVNGEVRKVYLSAIIDNYDKRILSYVIGDHNDNDLVMATFDQLVEKYPNAHPLLQSDYTEEKTMPKLYSKYLYDKYFILKTSA